MTVIARLERKIEPRSTSGHSPLFPTQPDYDYDPVNPSTTRPPEREPFRLCHYFDYICGTSLGG